MVLLKDKQYDFIQKGSLERNNSGFKSINGKTIKQMRKLVDLRTSEGASQDEVKKM